jgi:hypothetical protein
MNKSDSKSKRRLSRKVNNLQGQIKILEFKLEMKDKRIGTLERTLEDLEKELAESDSSTSERLEGASDGENEGRVDEETVGTGASGLGGSSGGNDDNLQSRESRIGEQVGEVVGDEPVVNELSD